MPPCRSECRGGALAPGAACPSPTRRPRGRVGGLLAAITNSDEKYSSSPRSCLETGRAVAAALLESKALSDIAAAPRGTLRRPVERRSHLLRGRVRTYAKGAFGRLNPVSQTPAGDEGARERGVGAIDRQRVIHHPAQA